MTLTFSHSGARYPEITGVFAFLIIAESTGLHVLLMPRHWLIAIVSSVTGLLGLVWLVRDYVALGKSTSEIGGGVLMLRIGRRAVARVPLSLVFSAIAPNWSDLEAARQSGYFNATKPAEPNVLIAFSEPVTVRVLGMVNRPIRSLALFVNNQAEFLAAITAAQVADVSGGRD